MGITRSSYVINDLDRDEQDLCFQYLENKPKGLLYAFTFYLETGIRASEGLALTLGDMRKAMALESPYIIVETLKQAGKTKQRRIPIRRITVHPNHHFSLYTLTKDWLKIREKEPDSHALITQMGDRVKTLKKTRFMHRKNLHAAIKKVFIQCGFRDRRLHDLRHTFAVNRLHEGMTLPVLQNVLGHSTLEATSAYVKPRMSDIFEQMNIKSKR